MSDTDFSLVDAADFKFPPDGIPAAVLGQQQAPYAPPLGPAEVDKLFRELIAKYGRALHYFVLRRVGNEADAADIAQQAFVEAALGFQNFRGEAGVSTWIFGIATNLTRNFLNRAPHRRHIFETMESLDDHEAPDTDPGEAYTRREAVALLSAAVEALPANMSEALLLVSLDGLSYEEAAERLKVPVGTVRSRVSRARALVRERLQTQAMSSTEGASMEVFEGLQRIKRIREDSREAELRHCRRELDRATQALREAQEHQQSADTARRRREQDMYSDVMSRLVVVADLDDLHTEMERLKEEFTRDALAVETAHEKREERRTEVGEATQAWRAAAQAREKFDTLLHEQRLLRRQEDERAAELELEDHPLRSRDAAQLLEA